MNTLACYLIVLAPILANAELTEQRREWIEKNWQTLDATKALPVSEQVHQLTGALRGIGSTPPELRSAEEQKLFSAIQEHLLGTPGHAEQYRATFNDYHEGGGLLKSLPAWRPQYAFSVLRYLPSPETVGLLADLLDYFPPEPYEYGTVPPVGAEAARELSRLLADGEHPKFIARDEWLSWRKELRDGATFRFAGSNTIYTLEGPVRGTTSQPRPDPTTSHNSGGTGNGESNGANNPPTAALENSPRVVAIILIITIIALGVFLIVRKAMRRG